MLDLQTAKDRRQREGSGYFWINIQQRLLSKERMKKTDEELDRLCKIVKVRRNPEDRGILANKACKRQQWNAQHTLKTTRRRTHIVLNLVVCSTHAWALVNHARMRDSSLHKSIILVMFGVVCSIAHHKHLFILSHSPRSALHDLSHLKQDALRFRRGHRWQETGSTQAQRRWRDCLAIWPTPSLSHTLRRSWHTNQYWRLKITSKSFARMQIWSDQRNTWFSTGIAGTDVIVPSASIPEIWVNACTGEVQICRQIAATDTFILTENQSNETSESSGQPAAQDATLIAKGKPWAWATSNSRQKCVCCSMLKRSSRYAQSGFFQQDSPSDKARGKTWTWWNIFMERIHGDNSNRPNMIDSRTDTVSDSWKTHQSKKEMNFAG